ncbi:MULTISPECIES: hypothetical protein [Actinopolyspora]|uniref:Uncharacterized protein n=1 Tax=Actinopolyspora saharensis TaxID=995062 RepID=A0A1H1GX89_9ACTN|nr:MULTISPECIES: hypothetical protein [Actinopolyspora]NHD17845.1 hypothetical protein [Actinopolyspora sp. BKK2]NHE77718.1 hypothetical protein [Actinopolyspora sp. BKK1]SDR17488.1 hypothetical protein SAMN04489718_3930 [Actinopolyspora saharensis]
MHPPQPPGGQQFAQPAPGQQPHGGQAWPAGTEQTGSSGITSWVAALLGCFVALGTQVGMLVILLNRASTDLRDVLAAVGSIAVLSVPPLVGASGVLARKRFGRWLLIGGLVLPVVLYGWITYVDPLLWPLCFFVGSLAAIALALSPTTGNYLREGDLPDAAAQAAAYQPVQPAHAMGQQPFGDYQGFPGGYGYPQWDPQWNPRGSGYPQGQWPNQH